MTSSNSVVSIVHDKVMGRMTSFRDTLDTLRKVILMFDCAHILYSCILLVLPMWYVSSLEESMPRPLKVESAFSAFSYGHLVTWTSHHT